MSQHQWDLVLAADEQSMARQQAALRRHEAQRIAQHTDRGHAVVVLEISRRAEG